MRVAHQPETFGIALAPVEMDRMVEVFRMHVRDYEVDEMSELMLAEIEKAYEESGRELAGGRTISMEFLLGQSDEDDEDDDGGGVAALPKGGS